MRLVNFDLDGVSRLGALTPADEVVDLQAAAAHLLRRRGDPFAEREAALRIPASTAAFLQGGERSTALAAEAFSMATGGSWDGPPVRHPRAAVRLNVPLRPGMIVCGGGNFWDHLRELGRDKPEHVEFFLKNPLGVIGPDDDIPYQPWLSRKLDYEAELGIIIGRRGRNISREAALDHVFGYTAVNDMSIRDRQMVHWDGPYFHLRYGEGKTFDGNLVLGPAIVTKDEVPDVAALPIRCWVDGELRQNNNTANYVWGVAEVVEYYSSIMTLEPGFLICPGTPGGCAVGADAACGGKPAHADVKPGYLTPGSTVIVEVGGIGRLENRIREIAPPARSTALQEARA